MTKEKRQDSATSEEEKINRISRIHPFSSTKDKMTAAVETWENHFKLILNRWQSDAAFPPTTLELEDLTIVLFTEEKVEGMIT
jgi:hypothetical protein